MQKGLLFSAFIATILMISTFPSNAANTTLYYSDFASAKLDGKVDDGEYPTTFKVADHLDSENYFLNVAWGHNKTHIFIALWGEFTGWVGFGMNEPGAGMTGADMVISSVKNGVATAQDYHAIGNTPPIVDDSQFPIEVAGTEENGITTVELRFPLASDDTAGQDHNWEIGGTYGFFFAAHESSDTLTYHTWHSDDELSVTIADVGETPAGATVDIYATQNGSPFPLLGLLFAIPVLGLIRKKIE
ncbi:MAG: hypothetical protein D6732_11665 [Methanobacteriota archaeon]|nr:MAG: hypothetical protein D6732_11665 [Euryarchaeota archaeon]